MQSLVLATLQGLGSSYIGGTTAQNSFIPLTNSAGLIDSSFLPTATSTTGTSILAGNGSGGFNNVTIGTNLTYTSNTLSATGGTTSGSSILAGNGSGGFSNVTVGSGLSYSGGTLSTTSSNPVTALIATLAVSSLAYSRTSTTVTVTQTAHGYSSGMKAEITAATDSGLNSVGNTITVTGANTWTFITASTGTSTGTLTLRSLILKTTGLSSVQTNGIGNFTLNFSSNFSDVYYKLTGSGLSQSYAATSGTPGCVVMENYNSLLKTVSSLNIFALPLTTTSAVADCLTISIVIYP